MIIGLTAPFSLVPIKVQYICGLMGFAIIFWLFQPIKLEETSFLLIAGFLFTELTDFEDVLLTFSSDTPWLIIAGMAISISLIESKIANLFALNIANLLSKSIIGLVLQMHLLGLLTAIIVPSGLVRVIILLPLGKAIAAQYGEHQKCELQKVILLSLTLSTVVGGFGILTGAVPNMIAAGLYTEVTNIPVTWSNWFLWMFPSASLFRVITSAMIISIIYSGKFGVLKKNGNLKKTKFDRKQYWIMAIITGFVVGLFTDSIHNYSPLQVCLLTILAIFSRPIGPLPIKSIIKVNFGFLFYVVALFALGDAIETSGLVYYYKSFVVEIFDSTDFSLPLRYFVTALSPVPLSLFMDVAAVAALLVPIFVELAPSIGLEPYSTMMALSLGTSIVFLPYQAAPLMLAYSSGDLPKDIFLKILGIVSFVSAFLLYPAAIVYWLVLGLV
ncbi:MAG: SLC13 family permease [Candidatus Latescibacterota bacterium]|nr:SLC13 family permease [Candidatus Latescibacterota bacterium]